MFIDMLLKTIPHSKRAAVALVVMLSAFWPALMLLQDLLLVSAVSIPRIVLFVIMALVTLAAAVCFYYFQAVDGKVKMPHEVETLNKYHEAERYKKARATPVFSSHDGEIGPKDKIGLRK